MGASLSRKLRPSEVPAEQAFHLVRSWARLALASLLDRPAAAIVGAAAMVVELAHLEAHDEAEAAIMSVGPVVAEMAAEVPVVGNWGERMIASGAPCASACEEAAVDVGTGGWGAYSAHFEGYIWRAAERMRIH